MKRVSTQAEDVLVLIFAQTECQLLLLQRVGHGLTTVTSVGRGLFGSMTLGLDLLLARLPSLAVCHG